MRQVPDEVQRLAEERTERRAVHDYSEADRLRDRIRELGFEIVDRPDGFDLLPTAPPSRPRRRPAEIIGVLDRPPTEDFSVLWLAERWPEDVLRGISSFRKFEDDRSVQHVVVETESAPPTEWPPGVDVVPLAGDPGFGEARNVGFRLSAGRIVIVTDGSMEATDDVYAPLTDALKEPTVGIAGPFGVVTDDLHEFREDDGPDVDAIEAFLMAFRRELVEEGLAFDRKFRFFRNADIDLSFQVKALGLRAVRVDLPLLRHEHRAWSTTLEQERDRLSKRNFYRFLDRFRGRTDLLVGGRD
jgi:cysteinyl-tRNA synthetase